ncbi:MAG: DUF177 domain-containing protein [Methyloligellaceae bacterium]
MNAPEERRPELEVPLTQSVDVRKLPESGVTGVVTASAEQCEAIAQLIDLISLQQLSFSYRLTPLERDRVHLSGRLEAQGEQKCVVSLDPVAFRLEEDVDLEFWPQEDLARLEQAGEAEAYELDPSGPEPLEGSHIDVGRLAYELLVSSLDPYPRKEGVSFQWEGSGEDEAEQPENPFDALASLRDKLK